MPHDGINKVTVGWRIAFLCPSPLSRPAASGDSGMPDSKTQRWWRARSGYHMIRAWHCLRRSKLIAERVGLEGWAPALIVFAYIFNRHLREDCPRRLVYLTSVFLFSLTLSARRVFAMEKERGGERGEAWFIAEGPSLPFSSIQRRRARCQKILCIVRARYAVTRTSAAVLRGEGLPLAHTAFETSAWKRQRSRFVY